jgi:hypothetical protein
MNLFIAVVFFCVGGQCYFWQGNQNYYTKAECEKVVKKFVDELYDKGAQGAGTCLPVSTRNNI